MMDYKGARLTEAGPSVPVEIAGLSEAPSAGSPFFAVADERMARELVEQRKAEEKAKAAAPVQKVSLENLFDQIRSGERKELALIVKADVQGSVEAVKASLEKLSNDEVNVRVIHGGVGAINESDVMLPPPPMPSSWDSTSGRTPPPVTAPRARTWICGCTGSSMTASTRSRRP